MKKRGIVISGVDVTSDDESSFTVESNGIKASDLRFYLTYFDLIERPINNVFHFAPSSDELYLASCNVLTNTEVTVRANGLIGASILVDVHDHVYLEKTKDPDGIWVKGSSGVNFIDKRQSSRIVDVVEMSLYELLPCPADSVPLADILEFKLKRGDELIALRAHLDEVYEEVSKSGDIPRAQSAATARLSQSIKDLHSVVQPSFASKFISGLRVQIDPINLTKNSVGGGLVAASFALPVEIGAAAGAVLGSIKFDFARTSKDIRLSDGLKDFSYIVGVEKLKA